MNRLLELLIKSNFNLRRMWKGRLSYFKVELLHIYLEKGENLWKNYLLLY